MHELCTRIKFCQRSYIEPGTWHASRESVSPTLLPQARRKGFDMATSAARHGPSAIRHAPAPRYRGRYTHPRCPLPSSASPPRPRHGKSPRHCLRAFVLSQRLHLVSIVCDVSVGRRRGLSGACYSACMTQTRRPSTGRESFLPLYLTLFVVYLVGVGLPLGQEQFSSSRAIPGVFRIAAATCGGFLPRNRVETDKECRHVSRRR